MNQSLNGPTTKSMTPSKPSPATHICSGRPPMITPPRCLHLLTPKANLNTFDPATSPRQSKKLPEALTWLPTASLQKKSVATPSARAELWPYTSTVLTKSKSKRWAGGSPPPSCHMSTHKLGSSLRGSQNSCLLRSHFTMSPGAQNTLRL